MTCPQDVLALQCDQSVHPRVDFCFDGIWSFLVGAQFVVPVCLTYGPGISQSEVSCSQLLLISSLVMESSYPELV